MRAAVPCPRMRSCLSRPKSAVSSRRLLIVTVHQTRPRGSSEQHTDFITKKERHNGHLGEGEPTLEHLPHGYRTFHLTSLVPPTQHCSHRDSPASAKIRNMVPAIITIILFQLSSASWDREAETSRDSSPPFNRRAPLAVTGR